jgi:hypothetical protein
MSISAAAHRLEETREYLSEEVEARSNYAGTFKHRAFLDYFIELAEETGDAPELIAVDGVQFDGSKPYKVDAWFYDEEKAELTLVNADYCEDGEIQNADKASAQSLFTKCLSFYNRSLKEGFLSELEETSDAYYLASTIRDKHHKMKRVRIIVFTNRLSVLRNPFTSMEAKNGKKIITNLFDLERYQNIYDSLNSSEPLEIKPEKFGFSGIPCLSVKEAQDGVESYLCVVPGAFLAKIYETYGSKLLEQNVRVFLQARTLVNRKIIETATSFPGSFFSYNNGITATATDIELRSSDEGIQISSFTNLQLVNGGQTTASLLYAMQNAKSDLGGVYVQMKLSKIATELVSDIVPKIAEYSNTQNKINPADLTSNHDFHLFMERASRRYAPPLIDGEVPGKWFYERARGSYRNEEYKRKTGRDKNAFKFEYPRHKLLVKTDLAKYSLTFECRPHIVCKGAANAYKEYGQKIFKAFEKDENSFNELYFKREIGKAILFRNTDKEFVEMQDWYRSARGHKAETTAYTLAYLSWILLEQDLEFDFLKFWELQGLPHELGKILERLTPRIREFLMDPGTNQQNVAEFAKKEVCWQQLCSSGIEIDGDLKGFVVNRNQEKEKYKAAKVDKKKDNELVGEILVRHPEIRKKLDEIVRHAVRLDLMTPASQKAIGFIRLNNQGVWSIRAGRTPMNAFLKMLHELKELGHDFFPRDE